MNPSGENENIFTTCLILLKSYSEYDIIIMNRVQKEICITVHWWDKRKNEF